MAYLSILTASLEFGGVKASKTLHTTLGTNTMSILTQLNDAKEVARELAIPPTPENLRLLMSGVVPAVSIPTEHSKPQEFYSTDEPQVTTPEEQAPITHSSIAMVVKRVFNNHQYYSRREMATLLSTSAKHITNALVDLKYISVSPGSSTVLVLAKSRVGDNAVLFNRLKYNPNNAPVNFVYGSLYFKDDVLEDVKRSIMTKSTG